MKFCGIPEIIQSRLQCGVINDFGVTQITRPYTSLSSVILLFSLN